MTTKLTGWDLAERVLGVLTVLSGPFAAAGLKFVAKAGIEPALAGGLLGSVTLLAGSELLKRYRTTERIDRNVMDAAAKLHEIEIMLKDHSMIEYIDDLADVYQQAAEMISTAQNRVRDTTWGRELANDDDKSADARKKLDVYRKAVTERAKASGVIFQELYGLGSQARYDRLKKALMDRATLPDDLRSNHRIRLVQVKPDTPVMDMLIVDTSEMLLTADKTRYCRIRSETLTGLFQPYFDAVWDRAERVKLRHDGKILIIDNDTKERVHEVK